MILVKYCLLKFEIIKFGKGLDIFSVRSDINGSNLAVNKYS